MAGRTYVYRNPPRRRPRRVALKSTALHVFYDVGIALEGSGVTQQNLIIADEWNSSQIRLDTSVAAEHLISIREDAQSPVEWRSLAAAFYDLNTPIGWSYSASSDRVLPFEYGGSVTAISYDDGLPIEWAAALRTDYHSPIELSPAVPVFYDVSVVLGILQTAAYSSVVPLEWSGTPNVVQSIPAAPGKLPLYTDADFQRGMQNLLPTGPVWPRDPDAQQTQVIGALTKTYTRQALRSESLLVDAFPLQPVELLPEWELSLGLPDPCTGPLPTIQQRQQQVAARFLAGGGQSVQFFISFAASLGYTITITQFTTSRFGRPFGLPFNGAQWAFAWQVNAPTFTVEPFLFGRDAFGEPFASWGNTVLQCEMQRLAPAHTKLVFSYS